MEIYSQQPLVEIFLVVYLLPMAQMKKAGNIEFQQQAYQGKCFEMILS
tara:strand:- start:419 stop:562 length:144 start_codon:yes stop_codon:yes gene_type:complete